MKSSIPVPGGELEHAVLSVLWDLEKASPREIYARVGVPRGLVYTTIAKVLDRLHLKRLVARARSGRTFVYRPRIRREVVEHARAAELLRDLLHSKPEPAIAGLVDALESTDPTLLDELSRLVEARRRMRRGS